MVMNLYQDCVNLGDCTRLIPVGLIKKITINPILAKKSGLNYHEVDWLDFA